MAEKRDYYEVLGVSKSASHDEITKHMSLPTSPLKMGQNIRNDGYIVLTSIKKQAL